MSISNKDYLNELIAKAKKSWEGVDVDSYMSDLRDMKTETIKCRDLMVGDWITDEHGFPMQITTVGEDYAYATFEGNEGDPWEFDDKDYPPYPIEITEEIMKKNKWAVRDYTLLPDEHYYAIYPGRYCLILSQGILSIWFDCVDENNEAFADVIVPCKYVHQLQQVLRIAGMTDMANNFKI